MSNLGQQYPERPSEQCNTTLHTQMQNFLSLHVFNWKSAPMVAGWSGSKTLEMYRETILVFPSNSKSQCSQTQDKANTHPLQNHPEEWFLSRVAFAASLAQTL